MAVGVESFSTPRRPTAITNDLVSLPLLEGGLLAEVGGRLIVAQQMLGEVFHHPLVDVRLVVGVGVPTAGQVKALLDPAVSLNTLVTSTASA